MGGHWKRCWGTGIVTTEILGLSVLTFVTVNSQSKKSFFSRYQIKVSPGNCLLTKKPEDQCNVKTLKGVYFASTPVLFNSVALLQFQEPQQVRGTRQARDMHCFS